jgi:hypothetical protein
MQLRLRLLPAQEGAWNKVGLMRQLLADVPPERAQWLLWAQPDAIIDDIAFSFPFDNYQDKDLILLGNGTRLRTGNAQGLKPCLALCCCNALLACMRCGGDTFCAWRLLLEHLLRCVHTKCCLGTMKAVSLRCSLSMWCCVACGDNAVCPCAAHPLQLLREEDTFLGLDLGVFLLRNSAWSRRFLDVLAHEARSQPFSQVPILAGSLTRSLPDQTFHRLNE